MSRGFRRATVRLCEQREGIENGHILRRIQEGHGFQVCRFCIACVHNSHVRFAAFHIGERGPDIAGGKQAIFDGLPEVCILKPCFRIDAGGYVSRIADGQALDAALGKISGALDTDGIDQGHDDGEAIAEQVAPLDYAIGLAREMVHPVLAG